MNPCSWVRVSLAEEMRERDRGTVEFGRVKKEIQS